MKRATWIALMVAALCSALLSGCGAKADEGELSANPWVATYLRTSAGDEKVLAGTSPAIYFRTDGAVVGNASVNAFRGSYVMQGRNLQIGSLTTTEWDGPQQTLAQEQAVLEAIQLTQRYAVAQDELILYGASNDPLARFAVAPAPELVGPLWLCTQYEGDDGQLTAVTGPSPLGAEFAPSGALSGTGGVNSFTTAYTIEGSKMTVDPDISVTEEPGPADMDTQEASYLDALRRTASYRIEEYQLTLTDAAGADLAVFIPLAPKQ